MHKSTSKAAWSLAVLATIGLVASASAKPPKETAERALKTLERGARSGDFTTRAMAVAGLGYGPKKRVMPLVKEALTDQQWQVRRASIQALFSLKDKKAWEKALISALRAENLNAQNEVLPLLEPLGQKTGVKLMLKAMSDKTFPKPERYALALKGHPWMVDVYVQALTKGLKKNGAAQDAFRMELDKLPLPDALPIYSKVFAKQPPAVQKQILDYVIDSPKVDDLGFLVPLLKKMKDDKLAFRISQALAIRGNAAGRDRLVAVAKDPEASNRLEALRALVGVAGKDLFPILQPIVNDDKGSVELAKAAYAIYAKVGHPKLARHLEAKIDGTDLDRRAAAVTVYGAVKGREALEKLHPLLNDGNRDIRLGAAKAVGDLKQRESIVKIREALFNERDEDIKVALLEALGEIRDQECVPVLRFQVSDRSAKVRHAAVKSLAAVRHQSAVGDLEVALRDVDQDVRRTALLAILELGPKQYGKYYEQAMSWITPDDVMRLTKLHKRDMLPLLVKSLSHDRPELREGALAALKLLDKGSQLAAYKELAVKAKRADMRVAGLEGVIALEGKAASAMLTTLSKDPEKLVRVTAIEALGVLGAKDATAMLTETTNDTDERVRVAAAAALMRL